MATLSPSPSQSQRPLLTSLFGFDWPLLLVIVFLGIWGIFSVASATMPANDAPAQRFPEATKQMVFVAFGLCAMIAVSFANFRWLVHLQGWFYWLNIAALALVLVLPEAIAPRINGAKSWIVLGPISLQMAEFSKFAILLSLGAYITRRQDKITHLKTVFGSLLYIALPLLLIMRQPDFGTTLATLSIWFGILFFGGAKWQHLLLVLALFGGLFGAAFGSGKLKPHQVERLTAFLYPDNVKREGSYQLNQSLIAIGGGQVSGQGYEQGAQNRANYVPENDTDFIFTVVAEEFGFVGGALLLGCYALLLFRTATLALATDNYFGVLLCGGFTFLLAFHVVVNIGMTMRVMPITGVPLPFFSKGGSSFLAFSLCAGLLQSVSAHRSS